MGETGEFRAEKDVGHVLVSVQHVEAPSDVEDTGGVINRPRNAHWGAGLERTLKRRGHTTPARRSVLPPSIEPRDEGRHRSLFHSFGGSDGHLQKFERDALTYALPRDQDLFGAHELGQRLNGDCAANNRVSSFRAESGNVVAPLFPRRRQAVDDLPEPIDRQLIPV